MKRLEIDTSDNVCSDRMKQEHVEAMKVSNLIDSPTGSPAGAGNTPASCYHIILPRFYFTFFTTAIGSVCKFSMLGRRAANSSFIGELSLSLLKTQDLSRMISFEVRLTPYVPLSNQEVTNLWTSAQVW